MATSPALCCATVLVVAWDIPASAIMPGSPRLFSLCRELSRHHELHLATRCSSEGRYQWFVNDPETRQVFKSLTILPDPPSSTTWWRRQQHRVRRGAYFDTRYLHPEYYCLVRDTIQALAAEKQVDILYVDGLATAQYVESTAALPAFLDIHDSWTLLLARSMTTQKRRTLALRLEAREAARRERALAQNFSLVITNSPVDESVIKRLAPSVTTLTIGNGVDTEFFRSNGRPIETTKLVFTGVLDYGPNEDAAVYFCESILPSIRERVPTVEFWVVGSAPTARVRSLAQRPGVHVTGSVPDVRPYLESAALFVCPLRFGSGVKNKILAALAMGKPVVATRVSLEGLDLQEDHDLLVADDAASFADQVLHLLNDRRLAEELGRTGQSSVRQRYSWRVSGQRLDEAVHALIRTSG